MYPFFESIAIIGGIPRNIELHQERMERTYQFHYQTSCPFYLQTILENEIIINPASDKYKWKFLYSKNQYTSILNPYISKLFKQFHLLHSAINYPFKYSDRSALLKLKSHLMAIDEIIIIKDSFVTDTSFSNLIFFDGQNWITPSSPLLLGTMRHKLLQSRSILTANIHLEDLKSFSTFQCINALNDMSESPVYSMSIINTKYSNSHG
ncbi:MAG: aminotransferase class IV [Saprospiraceae bacterium]|nr:aminotransferase class IV [Saprospiraceae bacterium]